MDPRAVVEQYYHAWQHRAGDMTGVPLAEDFAFHGPVASFDDAEGYRAMARQAGAAVRDFRVRRQFVDGEVVCSIIDWEMDPLPGTLTAAELLHVRDGRIVSGELIYDAEELRRAMAAAGGPSPVELLTRSFAVNAKLLGSITADGWAAPSKCAGWTVRQAANHLTGGLLLVTRVTEGEAVDPGEFDAQVQADTDHLGDDPATAFGSVAERILAVLGEPGALDREFPFSAGPTPGAALASIGLLESLVHGWDIAAGAGVDYPVDDDVVEAVLAFARHSVGDDQRHAGLFADPVPTGPTDTPFMSLLGHLGRRA